MKRQPPAGDDAAEQIERAIEDLLRLHASRKRHAARAEVARVKISAAGYVLLQRIQDHGPISLAALARLADMDPAVATRQVRQLENESLVRRSSSREDGRVTLVALTAKGRRAHQRITEVRDQELIDVLQGWSRADRARLADGLARLVDELRRVRLGSADDGTGRRS